MLRFIRQPDEEQFFQNEQVHLGLHEACIINGFHLDMNHTTGTLALAKELATAVPAKLLCHRYPRIVWMLVGFRCSLKDIQVTFCDKHEGPKARTDRPATIIAMAIMCPYKIAIDRCCRISRAACHG